MFISFVTHKQKYDYCADGPETVCWRSLGTLRVGEKLINFNQLRAFHEAAKTQNFSLAARSLHVTQPAVTAHIRALEQSLGVKLFRKRGRRVVLSDTGALLFRYSLEVFELEKKMEQAIMEVRQLERGLLKIGTSKTYARRLMPPLMTRFHAAFPKVRMVLDEGSSREMCRTVLELKNELAVVARMSDVKGLTFVPFRREKVSLYGAPGHALAGRTELSVAELEDQLVIMREEGSGIQRLVRDFFETRGVTPNVLIETGNIEFIKEMVERGDALSFLVESSVVEEVEQGLLVAIPLADEELTLDVTIAYVEDSDLSPAAAAFLEILLKEGAELEPEFETPNRVGPADTTRSRPIAAG
jgi:DNA-binding transcriptional LysR family regulator